MIGITLDNKYKILEELGEGGFGRVYLADDELAKRKVGIKILLDKSNFKSQGKDTTALEQHIDTLIYKLYDLTYAEVKIIEPEFGMSEWEYESV